MIFKRWRALRDDANRWRTGIVTVRLCPGGVVFHCRLDDFRLLEEYIGGRHEPLTFHPCPEVGIEFDAAARR